MAITKAQWEQVRSELWDSFGGSVEFSYQGHKITCQAVLDNRRKLVVRVFLNSSIKGSWFLAVMNPDKHPSDDPEVALLPLFWNVKRKALYNKKFKDAMLKIYGKRRVKQECPDLDDVVEGLTDSWGSATRMIAQFKKVEGLELVRVGYRPMVIEVNNA